MGSVCECVPRAGDSSSTGEERRDVSACRSEPQRFTLTKEDKIRQSSDYRRIATQGRGYRTPNFRIRILGNPLGIARLGIAAGRKTGNACARNRIKRRLREFFRLNRDRLPRSTDIVFIALKGAAHLDTRAIFEEVGRFFDTEFALSAHSPSGG